MIVATAPFKHAILHDYWSDDLLERVLAEFPAYSDSRWQRFANEHENKLGGSDSMLGPAAWELFDLLGEDAFLEQLAERFGIGEPLTLDATGGGFHLIPPGGFLAAHVDFNQRAGLWRRLTLIIFLNRGWSPADGGELVLGADRDVVVAPTWNTTVVFETFDQSWHGHPAPTADTFWRRSFAAYFYSEEPPPLAAGKHSTVWLESAA